MLPQGYVVNDYLTDTDAFFVKTDAPNGLKHFERMPMATAMDPDFDTGNMRYKARERYSFGFSDPRAMFGSPGSLIKIYVYFWGDSLQSPFFMYNKDKTLTKN